MMVSFRAASGVAVFSSLRRYPCCVRKVYGFCFGTAGVTYFLHIFDTYAVPANGTSPLRSLQLIGQDGFSYSFEETEINTTTTLSLALSSTDSTYTAVTDGAVVDLQGEVDQIEMNFPSTSSVGDLTTGVGSLQVWSEAAGTSAPKKLLRLEVTNNSGDAAYPIVTFTDSFSLTDTTAISLEGSTRSGGLADGTTKAYSFGRGQFMFKNDAGTIRKGCTIRFSSTPVIPYVEIAGTSFNVRAIYNSVS